MTYFITESLYLLFPFTFFIHLPTTTQDSMHLCLLPTLSFMAVGVWVHMYTFLGVYVPMWLDVSVNTGAWGLYIL